MLYKIHVHNSIVGSKPYCSFARAPGLNIALALRAVLEEQNSKYQ